jgi:hypothetical protein
MTLSDTKDVATIIGVTIAVVTLLKGFLEYRRNLLLGRVEHFSDLKKEFKEDVAITRIRELLEADDPQLAEVSPQDKWQFLCFFEEAALLLRAKLITSELAYYMFGYYAARCDRSQWFWKNFPKDEKYWLLFFDFVARMKSVESFKEQDHRAFAEKIRT